MAAAWVRWWLRRAMAMKICFKRFQWAIVGSGPGWVPAQGMGRFWETLVLLCLPSLASAGTSMCSTGLKSLSPYPCFKTRPKQGWGFPKSR